MSNGCRKYWLTGLTIGIGTLIILFLFWIILFKWGTNQALTPEHVSENLRIGMTVREVEMALAMPEGSVTHLLRRNDGLFYADVAKSGTLGSFFVPQTQITLIFNHDMKLVGCLSEIHWRADEYHNPVNIQK